MRFDALTVRTVASLLAGGLAGLTLALMGAGVWALVWQALIQRSVAVLVLWSMAPHGFRPAPSARHLHELAAFALPNMASRIMSWASGQIPRLILGVYLGPTGLGLFSMATRLNEVVAQVAILPKATVARVALRRFAANPTALRQAFRRDILQISFFAFPICIGGSAIIRPVVDAWLGARWQGAIVPSELMLLLGIPFTTIYMSASLLLALNRQRLEAVICAVQSVGTVVAVACVAPYGVPAAVAAILACAVGTVPLAVAAIRRQAHIPVKCILMPQVPSLLAACCIGLVILVLRPPLEHAFRHSIAIPAEILAGAVTYAVMVCLLMPRTVRGAIDEFRGRFSPTPRRAA
jgi:PST family polysaccharide transporter